MAADDSLKELKSRIKAIGGDFPFVKEPSDAYNLLAKSTTAAEMFGHRSNHYKLPRFQRPYVWKPEQVQRLIKEIVGGMLAQPQPAPRYMLGNIFLWRKGGQDDAESIVLDGYQRLTTIFLILGCLNYLAKNRFKLDADDMNFAQYLSYRDHSTSTRKRHARMIPRETLKEFTNAVLVPEDDFKTMKTFLDTHADGTLKCLDDPPNVVLRPVAEAMQRAMDTLELLIKTEQSLINFGSYLLNNVNIVETCIFSLKDPKLVNQTFILINDTGMTLAERDKSKSHLLFLCYGSGDSADADEADACERRMETVADVWDFIENTLGVHEARFGRVSTTLRLGEPLTNFDYLLSLLTKVINNATQEGTRGRQAKMAPDAATYAGFMELCKDCCSGKHVEDFVWEKFVPIASAFMMILTRDASNRDLRQSFDAKFPDKTSHIKCVKVRDADDSKKKIDNALVGLSCTLSAENESPANISWIPIAIRLIITFSDQPKTLAEYLCALEARVVFMMLMCSASGQHGGSRGISKEKVQEIYNKAIIALRDYARDERPRDENLDFSSILLNDAEKEDFSLLIRTRAYPDETRKNKLIPPIRLLLLKYESILNQCSDPRMDTGGFRIDYGKLRPDIEHILPQSLRARDKSEDAWHNIWAGEAGEKDIDSRLHQLGNLALVEEGINRAAKNVCYSEKKKYYDGKILNPKTNKKQKTSDWRMIKELKDFEIPPRNGEPAIEMASWRKESVDKRGERITEKLLEYFKLRSPTVTLDPNNPLTSTQVVEKIKSDWMLPPTAKKGKKRTRDDTDDEG